MIYEEKFKKFLRYNEIVLSNICIYFFEIIHTMYIL